MPDISPQEALAAWQAGELTILDCREPAEYAAQHVPGTLLIPMSELADRLDELPDDRPLAVLCRSGARSGRVADQLTAMGEHGEVVNIEGGILAWADEGLPYEGVPPS